MDKNNSKAMLVLAVICFPLIFAFWTHIRGSYEEVTIFFSSSKTNMEGLKKIFTALLGLIVSIITLFTPTKALKSPLSYLSIDIASRWENLKAVKDDPEKKRSLIIEMGITVIYLVVLSASYFYILKTIVQYDDQYQMTSESGILRVLMFMVVIAVFLAFTSFVVGKLEDIDKDAGSDESKRQQLKTYWSVGLIVGVLTSIALGNSLQTVVNDYFQNETGIPSKIYQNLGSRNEPEKLGDSTIDLFDK